MSSDFMDFPYEDRTLRMYEIPEIDDVAVPNPYLNVEVVSLWCSNGSGEVVGRILDNNKNPIGSNDPNLLIYRKQSRCKFFMSEMEENSYS